MGPTDFLRTLWGEEPPGFVQTWELRTKTSACLAHTNVDEHAGRPDVYTGVATSSTRVGARKRPTTDQAAAIAGLWLDLDVNGGPTNKTGELPSKDAATAVAHTHLDPTLIVDSGYGIHAWYLLPAPWRFRTRKEQAEAGELAVRWYQLHRQACNDHGGGLGATHDLARLLRLPGTLNLKDPGDPRPVTILNGPGRRYPLEVLRDLCGDITVEQPSLLEQVADVQALPLTPELRARLELLLEQVPEFADAWRHTHASLHPWSAWSMSEWDMSVCALAAHGDGFTDQDLASIVRAHRLLWNRADRKANRTDYLARTVARARARKPAPTHGLPADLVELAYGRTARAA